ncbi:MAG: hypothetical protein AB9858_10695 [Acidaminococcaceae bacterium]
MAKTLSWFLALAPVLTIYGFYGVDLATFLGLFLWPACLFYIYLKNGKVSFMPFVSLLLAYVVIITVLNMIFVKNLYVGGSLILFRLFKYVLWLGIMPVILNSDLFDFDYTLECYKKVCVCAAIYLILQQISFNLFSVILPRLFLPYTANTSASAAILQQDFSAADVIFFRPSAFFLEPAQFSSYILLALVLIFIAPGTAKKDKWLYFLVPCAVIASTSGLGYILLFALFLIGNFSRIMRNPKFVLGFILTLVGFAALYNNIAYVNTLVSSTLGRLTNFDDPINNAFMRRFSSYYFLNMLDTRAFIIGNGYGNILAEEYFNGLPYMIWTTGLLGTAIYAAMLFNFYDKNNFTNNVYLFFVLSMNIFAHGFTPISIVFTIAGLLALKNKYQEKLAIDG